MKKIIALSLLMFSLSVVAANNAPMVTAPQPKKIARMHSWDEIKEIWQRIEAKANQMLHNIMSELKGHDQDKQAVVMHMQTIKTLQQAADTKDLKKDSSAMKKIDIANKSLKDADKKVHEVTSTVRDQLKAAHEKIRTKRQTAQKAVKKATDDIKKATDEVNKA